MTPEEFDARGLARREARKPQPVSVWEIGFYVVAFAAVALAVIAFVWGVS